MKFFKKKDKKKDDGGGAYPGGSYGGSYGGGMLYPAPQPTSRSPRILATVPPPVLSRIFAFVCPHTQDESYESCEQSAAEDTCMLCDLRDLAHAGMVQKSWRAVAIRLLYHSIRIDQVHYCEREIYLSERRKRRSRFDRNGEPEDTAQARLKLLCRTLRDDPTRLGPIVRYLRLPYMLRESSQADLARTIAVLPNLIYVDLPEGLFADDPSYVTLRLEVQARCPDLRKMTYMAGSERSLELLARGTIWTRLEVLELIKINMDPAVLRVVLGAMQNLHALKVKQSEAFNDDVFNPSDMLPPFPPLNEFVLDTVPRITAAGLRTFLSRKETRDALRVLTLTATGVDPSSVHDVVARASNLAHLSIRDEVANPFPATANPPIPPFASRSLQTLHYEISSSPQATPYSNAAGTYYGYLASSILAGGLPNLRAVYVLDVSFPDALLGAPPLPPLQPGGGGSGIQRPGSSSNANGMFGYSGSGARPTSSSLLSPQYHAAFASRLSSNNPFAPPGQRPLTTGSPIGAHTLEVFTRGEDDVDWSFVKMPPPLSASSASNGFHLAPPPSFGHQRSQSGQQYDRSSRLGGGGDWPAPGILAVSGASRRPVSSYGLGADVDGLGWGQSLGSRKSVMVGSAAGGFLAVPSTDDYGRLSSGVAAVPTVPGQYHSGSGSLQPRGGGGDGGSEWPRPRSSAGHHSRSDWMG